MSFYAVEEIDDALERTKDLLLPFELSRWTRLAIITLFLGGTGFAQIFFQVPANVPSGSYESSGGHMTELAAAMDPASTATVAAAAALIFGAITIFMYLSSVFKFVMFRSIRDKDISIREKFGKHYVDGLKYLLFQLAFFTVGLGLFLGWAAVFIASPVFGILLILPAIPIGVVLAVFSGVVHDFALQEMIETDRGFVQSVKSSVHGVTADWREFGAYMIFRLIVSWAIGIMSFFTVMGATMLLAIPFLILGFLSAMLAPVLGLIVGVIGLLAWIIVMLYVTAPFKAYMYSYFVELYDAFMEV